MRPWRYIAPAIPPLAGAVAIIGVWYLTIAIADLDELLLPTPHDVAQAFYDNRSLLLENTWDTVAEAGLGLLVAVGVGAVLAVLIAEIKAFSRAFMPWLVVSQAIPKVAVAPLFVIWFGFGLAPKIWVAFFIAFFPIVISGASGLRSISREEIDLFRTITASRWRTYWHLKIPRALPQFLDGVKVGTTLALVGAIVGEFVSADRGLGYLVTISNRDLQTDLMFAVFVALSIVGMALFYLVILIERLLISWHFAQLEQAKSKQP